MPDENKSKTSRWFLPAALLVPAVLLTVAGIWDLQIAEALYNPQSLLGLWMEFIGWYPVLIPPLLLFLYYAILPKSAPEKRAHQRMGAVAAIACIAALFGYSYHKLLFRRWVGGGEDPRTYRGWGAWCFL